MLNFIDEIHVRKTMKSLVNKQADVKIAFGDSQIDETQKELSMTVALGDFIVGMYSPPISQEMLDDPDWYLTRDKILQLMFGNILTTFSDFVNDNGTSSFYVEVKRD